MKDEVQPVHRFTLHLLHQLPYFLSIFLYLVIKIYIYMYIYSCPPLTEQIAEFCVNLTSDLSVCQPALVFFPFFPLSATYIPDPTGNASCGDDWTYQIPFLTLHHCDTNSNFHWVKSFSKQDFEILKAKLVRQIKHVHDIRFHFVH